MQKKKSFRKNNITWNAMATYIMKSLKTISGALTPAERTRYPSDLKTNQLLYRPKRLGLY